MSSGSGNKQGGDTSKSKGNRLRLQEQARRKRLAVRLLTAITVPILIGMAAWSWATQPVSTPKRAIRLTVSAHDSVLGIGSTLCREGVVRSGLAFAITARLNGNAGTLKAGHYRFSGDMSLDKVIERLVEGPNDVAVGTVRVTIPEGFTIDQISDMLAERGIIDSVSFKRFATDQSAFSALKIDYPMPHGSLEGYLFPDTYDFMPRLSASQIAGEMLLNFGKRFYRPYRQDIDAAPGGLAALVTRASLIEREAKTSEDRPRIAGVIENRLRAGMKLQVDAAVMYGLPHKTRVVDADLKRDSPYNTYTHPGLPPGPIANPGIESLLAALHPENNEYLYYVARPNGSHVFTKTFAEHEAAIKRARLERTSSIHAAGAGQ